MILKQDTCQITGKTYKVRGNLSRNSANMVYMFIKL